MFTPANFINAKPWKQPRSSSVDKSVNKPQLTPDNGMLFTAKKRNALSSHEKTQRNLKCIIS